MIIVNFLLRSFLIMELVFASHYLQFARACTVLCGAGKEGGGEGFEEAVDQVDAIDNRIEKKHKIVPKKGLIGLKNILMKGKIRKENPLKKSALKEVKGLKGLKEVLENVPVMNESKSDEVQNNDPLETPGGLEGLKSILKTSSACEVSFDDQNWSHPPLLYNLSGLPILPLPSSKKMVVMVVRVEVSPSPALAAR